MRHEVSKKRGVPTMRAYLEDLRDAAMALGLRPLGLAADQCLYAYKTLDEDERERFHKRLNGREVS